MSQEDARAELHRVARDFREMQRRRGRLDPRVGERQWRMLAILASFESGQTTVRRVCESVYGPRWAAYGVPAVLALFRRGLVDMVGFSGESPEWAHVMIKITDLGLRARRAQRGRKPG